MSFFDETSTMSFRGISSFHTISCKRRRFILVFVKYSLMETLNSKGDYVMVEGTCTIDFRIPCDVTRSNKIRIL